MVSRAVRRYRFEFPWALLRDGPLYSSRRLECRQATHCRSQLASSLSSSFYLKRARVLYPLFAYCSHRLTPLPPVAISPRSQRYYLYKYTKYRIRKTEKINDVRLFQSFIDHYTYTAILKYCSKGDELNRISTVLFVMNILDKIVILLVAWRASDENTISQGLYIINKASLKNN